VDGQRIQARQSDGIHWTFDGSRAPAETISEQLEQDYGNIF
jgi:hypothetical protein